jgi:conjugation system TraG family ATPase
MERKFEDVFPILDIEHDCILSKSGDITVAFEVFLPEIFTRSNDEYEVLHQAWVKAIKVLPKYSIFHKQDWFTEAKFKPAVSAAKKPFLVESSERYFDNRPYLDHKSYVFLTKKPVGKKTVTSAASSLMKKSIVPEQTLDKQTRREFLDSCGQFKSILQDAGGIKLRRLTTRELASESMKAGVIERYCYLTQSGEEAMIREHAFGDGIQIGEQHCQLYTLADAEDLPPLCGSRINYEKYSTDKTKFPVGFAAFLGLLLPVNHIYNQYVFIDNGPETIKKLESKRTRLHSLSAYSRQNAVSEEAVNAFLNEAVAEQRTPVKAHFNVMVWTQDKEKLKDIKNLVSTALAQMEAMPKVELDGAAQIWWAGIPGNESEFPENDTFDTFAEQACCFFTQETNYQSCPPDEGIRFSDRISGKPVYVDLYDAPRKAGISSNMGTLVCGTSGGGKSMTVNHILRTLFDQGAHCVTVDIGGSYKGLCELVGGYYFNYTEENPIKFNPFYMPEGESLDIEKKESLKALLVSLWKQENESFNRSEYVALSNALQGYYDNLKVHPEIFPCFNSFYEYLEGLYVEVLKSHKVKDKDFDINNFLYVLRPYYKDGEFDFLLNAAENLDLLNQPFVVFELDNLKDNAILFPVCTLIICELFISKMRKLHGKRKVLTIDEAWKAIAKAGMAEFLKYAFKTIRKFNGIPIVITQELDDLVSSPVIKDAIINNADIKILMDMRKFINKFDKLQDVLGLSDKGKTILLSVNKDNREIFVDIGGQVQKVYKNELCPEEYYAYTTEGREKVQVMEYAAKHGSIQLGIAALVKDNQNQKAA